MRRFTLRGNGHLPLHCRLVLISLFQKNGNLSNILAFHVFVANLNLISTRLKQVAESDFAERVTGTLFHSDCLDVLKEFPSESVGLIYADPPFFTARDFFLRKSKAFTDKWGGRLTDYLNEMFPRFSEFRRLLRQDGTIYVHCDPHASHYLKVLLDRVFGYPRFVNEVSWKRQSAHCDSKQGARHFGRVHDTILVYSRSKNYVWNQLFVPYQESYLNKHYRLTEEGTGRRYAEGDLTAPGGFGNRNPYYEFLGVQRYWRYSMEKMERLRLEGRILSPKSGKVPKLKRYLDEMSGVPLQDVWTDVWRNGTRERRLYPTQKPIALLQRIVDVSTNPGSLVLDPFCGSGGLLVAAHASGRRWVGVDSSDVAIRVSANRLAEVGVAAKIVRNAR
jgi:DNA modification methylase